MAGHKLDFITLDDVVMGGKSSSSCSLTKDGHVEFKGNVNVNGGGFSTCVARKKEGLGLNEAHTGVRVTYRGNTSDMCVYRF